MITFRAGSTWTSNGPVGGVWLHHLGRVSDVRYLTRWPGGFLTASFRLSLPRGFTHPALRSGQLVEVHDGGRLGIGIMADPDRDGWTFTVDSLAKHAQDSWLALDSAKAPTTDLKVAIDEAAARGIPIRAGDSVPAGEVSALSADRAEGNYIGALADALCATTGEGWWVDKDGFFEIGPLPDDGVVDWLLTPSVPAMATASDDYASLYVVRRVSAVTGTEATDWEPAHAEDTDARDELGIREQYEDLSAYGLMSGGDATALATQVLSTKARPTYTQGVQVSGYRITTKGGGTPAHLTYVACGQRAKRLGRLDVDARAGREFVIGGTEYDEEAGTLVLTPFGMAARTRAGIMRRLTEKTKKAFT